MRNTKQNRARKVKWAKHQGSNLQHCNSPSKMAHNIKKEAAQKPPSIGVAFMNYYREMISTRKTQRAKDFASQGQP